MNNYEKITLRKIATICYNSRIRQGITLKDMSNKLGVTSTTLSQFEHGRNNSATILMTYINEVFDNEDYMNLRGVTHDKKIFK